MNCANCGTTNDDNAGFCQECGTKVELAMAAASTQPVVASATQVKNFCSQCGRENARRRDFCGGCSANLRSGSADALPGRHVPSPSGQPVSGSATAVARQTDRVTPLFPIAATTTQARLEWQVPIRKLPFVIGSGNGADLVLKARSLSPEHVQIVQQQGRYLIRDMASAEGTFVTYPGSARQERRINENAITDGSIIRLGDFGPMVFREQQSPALLISVRISGLPWMVGADDDNDLVLKGGGVLGRHAQVDIQSGRHVLRPLGQGQTHVSFTGDPQRERLVKDVNALREGSTIRIGEHLLTFRAGEN